MRERLGKNLTIAASGRDRNGVVLASEITNRITTVSCFKDLYSVGLEVMPCGHKHMKVHFAKRRRDGLECVIKMRFKPHCFKSERDEKAWRRSTEYLLNMPESNNIAKIYEVLEDSSTLYIVMEKVNGMDLFETLARRQESVSVKQACSIIQQLLRAMEHLHGCSAVHKDLKLENVMIDTSELCPDTPLLSPTSVKVIDFDTVNEWTPSSRDRQVLGTDQYIAPEAYAGNYSPQSDMFAIGVIAYKLLCGRFPFDAELFDDRPGENWVGSPKMSEIREKLKTIQVDFSRAVFVSNPQATSLVKSMLSPNERARPSAHSALQHAWFQELNHEWATSPPQSPQMSPGMAMAQGAFRKAANSFSQGYAVDFSCSKLVKPRKDKSKFITL